MIFKFIPRLYSISVPLKFLKLLKEMVRLDLPELHTYYQAAQVRNVMVWIQENPHIKRRGLELHFVNIPITVLPLIISKKVIH